MSDQARQTTALPAWPPTVGAVLSALIVAGVVYYSWQYGIALLPPLVALLFVGAAASVLNRILELLRSVFDNAFVAALSGITEMLSMLSGVVLVSWILWLVFSADANPIQRLLTAEDAPEAIFGSFTLIMFLSLALMCFLRAAILWWMVRSDEFGSRPED